MALSKRTSSLKSEHSSKFLTLVLDDSSHWDGGEVDGSTTTTTTTTSTTTKVPAKRNKTLYDSLHQVLERYNMSRETHSLFLVDSSPDAQLVPYSHEAHTYRDRTLHVRANDKHHVVTTPHISRRESKKSIAHSLKRFSQLLLEFEQVIVF